MTIRAAGPWLRHHWLELTLTAALAAPTALTPWLVALPVLWLAWWAGHEYRIHRRAPGSPPPTTGTTATDTDAHAEGAA